MEKRLQSLPLSVMFKIMERISINPEQCGGRPCVRGMRIRVKDVLDMLAGGATAEEILARRPDGVVLSNGPGDPAATGTSTSAAIQ